MPGRRLRIVALGLGPIGRAVCREIVGAHDLELVGAVDPAPGLAGKDLARIVGGGTARGARVAASVGELRGRKPDVIAHLSASRFPEAARQIREILPLGVPVVSTCEELIAAPWRWPKEARSLDRAAKKAGVAVLATGVNPGFVMDVLPAALANVCVDVRKVHVTRHVDTSTRRGALQAKTGAGITRAEFRKRKKEGRIGHVGLRDSLIFLMNHLPLEGEVGEETLKPILAAEDIRRGKVTVEQGAVAGVHQTVKATAPGGRKAVATFDQKMAFGLADPHDEIRFEGDPPLRIRIEDGVPGDRATVGSVLSTLRFATDAPAGLGF
ncbi:MAG TPA: dihydrodipicolinate reductase [bacterium]|nr:dihydrodipicolinate reductase [bacterium]